MSLLLSPFFFYIYVYACTCTVSRFLVLYAFLKNVSLRKCAERSPISPIEKSTLGKITRHLPTRLRENYANCVNQLLEEASREYETSLRTGIALLDNVKRLSTIEEG